MLGTTLGVVILPLTSIDTGILAIVSQTANYGSLPISLYGTNNDEKECVPIFVVVTVLTYFGSNTGCSLILYAAFTYD